MLKQADVTRASEALEEPPVLRLAGDAACGCVVICDHATNRLPREYDSLGMTSDDLQRHIAYDIGAGAVSVRLAEMLDAPAVLANFSRLLIDPNRGEDDPTLVMRLSDRLVIPGNAGVTEEEIERRKRLYYAPYHRAIDAAIDEGLAVTRPPVVLSIHSFTEGWRGRPRPWHVGILWDRDPRLARPLIEGLAREPGLVVGDNQPYTGKLKGDCLYKHGTHRGLAHALIEIRQDLVREKDGQEAWAERLARVLQPLLADGAAGGLHRIEYFGSWTDGPSARGPDGKERRKGVQPMSRIDPKMQTELEAAVFRRLVAHLRGRTDVQNIDMMSLAGFCRNCLSNWYMEAAQEKGIDLSKEESREIVYGMPYAAWKAKHQAEASPEQVKQFEAAQPKNGH